jgi:putative ABC transport system substrate-binding protein
MRRREFLGALGGAAATWTLAARAQQPAMPVVGFLHSGTSIRATEFVAAFRRGLSETGAVEGQNVAIDFRWADGHYDRLQKLAAELVSQNVAVIVTGGGFPSPLAAKAETASIPIVFAGGSDPVSAGLVVSLNRPGGNVTGALNFSADLTAKRLGLLLDLVPKANTIAMLRNPDHPEAAGLSKDFQLAARKLGLVIHIADARREDEFEQALATLVRHHPGGLFVASDPFYAARRSQLTALIARHAIPASYSQRQFVEAGGLMSYGTDFKELYRQAGVYAGRILKGEKPAELPVMQPTRFELVINLKTAKALGLTVPNSMQMLADDVIE